MTVASPAVAGVNQSQPSEIDDLRAEVSRLRETVSALSSPRYQPRQPSPRLRSPPPRSNMCWYHARFGDRARKCSPPCSYSGNGGGQHVKATDVAGPHHSRLFFITDRNSGVRFLVDTGAQVSVIPPPPQTGGPPVLSHSKLLTIHPSAHMAHVHSLSTSAYDAPSALMRGKVKGLRKDLILKSN